MALDCKYPTLLNQVYTDILAFYSDLFKINIRSALNFSKEVRFCHNITLLLFGSNFSGFGIILFCF